MAEPRELTADELNSEADALATRGWSFGTQVMNDMPLKTVQEMYVVQDGPLIGEVAYREAQAYDYEKRTVKTFFWARHSKMKLNRQGHPEPVVADTLEELLIKVRKANNELPTD